MITRHSHHQPTSIVIFMMMMMVWLTVSLPFVADSRLQNDNHTAADMSGSCLPGQLAEDAGFPENGGSEEKASSGFNAFDEEYLHHPECPFCLMFNHGKSHNHHQAQDPYCAFHGELLVPPPNTI